LLNTKNSVMFSRKTKAKKEGKEERGEHETRQRRKRASGPDTAMARRAEAIRAAAR
jgi:hypothetical protein